MIVQVRDVVGALRRELTDSEQQVLPEVARAVEAEAAAEVGRPIEPTAIVGEKHYLDCYQDTVRLMNTPIVSIQEVRWGTDVLDADSYRRIPGGIRFWSAPLFSTSSDVALEVDYTAGLSLGSTVAYAALKSVLADRIARLLGVNDPTMVGLLDPTLTESISVEGLSVTWRQGAGGKVWTDSESEILGGLRRRLLV